MGRWHGVQRTRVCAPLRQVRPWNSILFYFQIATMDRGRSWRVLSRGELCVPQARQLLLIWLTRQLLRISQPRLKIYLPSSLACSSVEIDAVDFYYLAILRFGYVPMSLSRILLTRQLNGLDPSDGQLNDARTGMQPYINAG